MARWWLLVSTLGMVLGCGRVVVDSGSEGDATGSTGGAPTADDGATGDGGSGTTTTGPPPFEPGEVMWEWQGEASEENWNTDIAVDPDGNVIVLGIVESEPRRVTWLAKLDPDGGLLWSQRREGVLLGDLALGDRDRIYGAGRTEDSPITDDVALAAFAGDGMHEFTVTGTVDAGSGQADDVTDLEVGHDGDLYVAGGTTVSFPDETPSVWVQRRTWQDGSVVWTWEEGDGFTSLAPRGSLGGMYACADTVVGGSGDLWTVSPEGDEGWRLLLPTSVHGCLLAAHGDGDVLATAWVGEDADTQGWARRYGPDGEERWTLWSLPAFGSIDAAPDGTWALASDFNGESFDHLVMKLDSEGNELWRWTATEPELANSGRQRVAIDPTGAPIVFTVVVTDTGYEFLVRKHAP